MDSKPLVSEDSEDNSCPICYESFDTADKISCGQCKKEMCIYCSAKWTKTCPFCNRERVVIDIERQNPQLVRDNRFYEFDYVCYKKLAEIFCLLMIIGTFYFFFFQPIISNDPDKKKNNFHNNNITNLINSTRASSSILHKLNTHLPH